MRFYCNSNSSEDEQEKEKNQPLGKNAIQIDFLSGGCGGGGGKLTLISFSLSPLSLCEFTYRGSSITAKCSGGAG